MPLQAICSICLEHFTPNCNIKSAKCGHIFHDACISQSFQRKAQCPVCRKVGFELTNIHLDFNNDSAEREAATCAVPFCGASTNDSRNEIDSLRKKLSAEELKNVRANQRIRELERQLKDKERNNCTIQQVRQCERQRPVEEEECRRYRPPIYTAPSSSSTSTYRPTSCSRCPSNRRANNGVNTFQYFTEHLADALDSNPYIDDFELLP